MAKSKGNSNKVNSIIAQLAIETKKDRNSLYSECVVLSFRHNGKLDCGFDNKDLQAWIDENFLELFDEKGRRKL